MGRQRRDGRSPGAPTSAVAAALGRRDIQSPPPPLQRRRSGPKAPLTAVRSSQAKVGKGGTPASGSGGTGAAVPRQRYTCPETRSIADKAVACMGRDSLRRDNQIGSEVNEYMNWMENTVLEELQDELHDKQLPETSIHIHGEFDSGICAESSIKMADIGILSVDAENILLRGQLDKIRALNTDMAAQLEKEQMLRSQDNLRLQAELHSSQAQLQSASETIKDLRGAKADHHTRVASLEASLEESQALAKKSEEKLQHNQTRRLTESEKENTVSGQHSNRKLSEFEKQSEVVLEQKRQLSRLERQLNTERSCAGISTPSEFMKISRRLDPDGLMHENSEMRHEIAGLKMHVGQIRWHNDLLQKYLPAAAQEVVAQELNALPLPPLSERQATTFTY